MVLTLSLLVYSIAQRWMRGNMKSKSHYPQSNKPRDSNTHFALGVSMFWWYKFHSTRWQLSLWRVRTGWPKWS
jgi:hypothetical protein